MRTRDLLFPSVEECFAISATRSRAIRYNLKEEKVEVSFEAKACFMTVYHDKESNMVVLTNR